MKPLWTVLASAVLALGAVTSARAAMITEMEFNSTRGAAQVIPFSAFTLPLPLPTGTVFDLGYPTATISGNGENGPDIFDIDFYAFTANGGEVYFDIDGGVSTFDNVLALFDSSGTLLAFNDDSLPLDMGSPSGVDAFIGVFMLPPGPSTYYIAVSPLGNFAGYPNAISFVTEYEALPGPNGQDGGVRVMAGAPPGDSSYPLQVNGSGTVPYTLHISVQSPTDQTVVPEPATMLLFGAGLSAVAVRMRRRR